MTIVTKNAADADVTYNAYRKTDDTVQYIGAAHSDLSKDMIIVKSASPKQVSGSYGNRRSSANYLISVSTANPDGTTSTKDMKVAVEVSLPAGVTFANLKEALRRVAGCMRDDAIATDLFHIGKVDR